MRAAIYDRRGPARDVLRIADVDRPEPGPGQVRVRVHVSGVNPTDWKSRAGATPRPIDGFQIPNQDGAGVVDAVGEGVDPGRVGERVWVWMAAAGQPWGTAAEWTVVPAERAVPLPDSASFELGASLGVPAMTAHRCLFADGPVEGKNVLVAGGAGAVGHFAIELARQAGADLVVNYRELNAADQVRGFATPIDRIVEVALGPNLELDLAVSGPETVVVTYAADGKDPVLPVRACMSANVTLRFILLYGVPDLALDEAAADITAAVTAGALTELPAHRFPLSEIASAHEAAEGGAIGKVIVNP